MIFEILLVLSYIRCSFTSPVGATPGAKPAIAKYTKDALTTEFKGLYWEYAFEETDGKPECTDDMLDVLVPALRKTKEFTGLLTDPDRKDYNTDGAWHTFYIRPNPDGKKIVDQDWNWNDNGKNHDNENAFRAINDNARIAASAPYDGVGSRSKAKRASVRCKDDVPGLAKYCADRPKLPAYTTQPGQGGTADNTWITFCPKFFAKDDIPNLDDQTKNKKRSSELYALRSREQVLAHEFMHVKTWGYRTHIEDLKDGDNPVYGGSNCEDFGWKYAKASPSTVNIKQELNADTYAWWFTAVWFQTKWNWPYDTTSTDKPPGWTDANGLQNGFDDNTSDDGGSTGDPANADSESGGQSTHSGEPDYSTCPGC